MPSGESMRERFPSDAPLRHVVEHIAGRHPSLPAFSLLQGFPRKRFGEAELACSLHSLGLTPNAALCIQTTPPETPAAPPSPASPLAWRQPQEEPTPPPAPVSAPVSACLTGLFLLFMRFVPWPSDARLKAIWSHRYEPRHGDWTGDSCEQLTPHR